MTALQHESLRGKTLLLGVGAQKSGTSWLYEYLDAHPSVTCSPIKELHYFDAWLAPNYAKSWDFRFVEQLHRLTAFPEEAYSDPRLVPLIDRVRMTGNPDEYFNHFRRINTAGSPYICEITPSYALINTDGLRTIQGLARKHGVSVRIMYLMRDPVDRLFSAMRHQERRGRIPSAVAEFRDAFQQPSEYLRGRYDLTLRRLYDVFGMSNVFTAFYETLFEMGHNEINRLTEFLSISPIPADFDTRVNTSPSSDVLPQDEIQFGIQKYQMVYEYISQLFPDAKPSAWRM